jgi:hypothetical protein
MISGVKFRKLRLDWTCGYNDETRILKRIFMGKLALEGTKMDFMEMDHRLG